MGPINFNQYVLMRNFLHLPFFFNFNERKKNNFNYLLKKITYSSK